MFESVSAKLEYDAPLGQIVVFPAQDILSLSGGQNNEIVLPDDLW